MTWRFATDVDAYAVAAGPLLAARPVENTISLTVLENALASRGSGSEIYGWYVAASGAVQGAVSHTPPYELLLGVVPAEACPALARALRALDRPIDGVNGSAHTACDVAAAWTRETGSAPVAEHVQRLHRLEQLVPSDRTRGRPRRATAADVVLLQDWVRRFGAESGATTGDVEVVVADRLITGGWFLWEDDDGRPVSVAGVNRPAAGAVRVGPVFTPPEHRRRGYGGAVTAAATRAVLDRGAREVVLFTDVANRTSNDLYRRLGYVPVEDRLTVRFGQP